MTSEPRYSSPLGPLAGGDGRGGQDRIIVPPLLVVDISLWLAT